MLNERRIADHIDWILSLEKKFPVEQWVIDGIFVWPLLRIRLNLSFFAAQPGPNGTITSPPRRYITVKSLLKNLWALLKFRIRRLAKAPIIGADFVAHRATLNNKLTDKYFDPIFDSFEGRYRGLIVEYELPEGISQDMYYKPERIVKLYEFRQLLQLVGLAKARFVEPRYELEGYDEFLSMLRNEGVNTTSYLRENVRRTVTVIRSLKWFWKKLFKKTKTQITIGLCYYTEPLYAMVLAAREENVISVDLQHGGQGKDHLAYARFWKVPGDHTYHLLPHYFWCWDDLSMNDIKEWIVRTGATHKVFTGGHPWLDYLRSLKWPQLDNFRNIVVLTLQPPFGAASHTLIADHVAATIQATAKEFKWLIRLHPRQLHQRDDLRERLNELGVQDDVDVEHANSLPMPAILSKASVHLTNSSGSAIEAALLGVPNVILDDVGASMFSIYIETGQAFLYPEKDPVGLAEIIRKAIIRKSSVLLPPINNWEFIFQLQ